MKQFLTIITVSLLLVSCSLRIPNALRYRNYKPVNDYGKKMELLQTYYPELYVLYLNGDIILEEMFEYTDRNGNPKVKISYRYRYTGR